MTDRSHYSETSLQTAKDYLVNYEQLGDVVPTIEGLADEMQRAVKTLYNWGAENEEFQHVLDLIMARQGRGLQNKSLRREIDPGVSKLLLSANHEKREKTDSKQEHNGTVELVITKQ